MHSSRMRTGRSLTVCQSLLSGGVSALEGGCLLFGGVSAPGGGVCSQGGVCSRGCLLRGCLLLGGVCSGGFCFWGVSALGGVCSGGSALGGSAQGGMCLFQGVSALGVGVSAPGGCRYALRQTPPLLTESQTPVKPLPWPNFVAAGKKSRHSAP